MTRTSRFSSLALAALLISLLAILFAWSPWRTRNGEWDGYGQGIFHMAWGAAVSIIGGILAAIGLFRGPRTAVAWTAFVFAVCFVAFFAGYYGHYAFIDAALLSIGGCFFGGVFRL